MSSPLIVEDPELLAAYDKADVELRVRALKACCVLAIVLKMSAVGMDHLIYPDLQWPIFAIRLSASAFMGVILLFLNSAFIARHIRLFGIVWAMTVQFAVCAMIFLSGDAASPYYAGLNLVILAIGVLLPWTFLEAALVCSLTLVCYSAAALLGARTARAPVPWNLFLGNVSFMLFTAAISLTSSYMTSRQRFKEFKLRHQLDKRNTELAGLDRLKTEFFANISHEFRTPLTLIIAPVDELLKSAHELPAGVADSLQLVRQNALRLLKLINDLLELVRLEHARTELKVEPLDLGGFVAALGDAMRQLATAKRLELLVHCPKTPLWIQGDARRLEKVVLNLLTNAIKFTPEGGRIEIRCIARDGKAAVEISDTGIGIAEADLPFLFQRFRQVDGSSTRQTQGLGIGLALARELLHEQHGTLSVRSVLGRGSTFTIELPLQASAAARQTETERGDALSEIYRRADRAFMLPETATTETHENPAAKATVLIVEDEPDMRRYLVTVLGREYRVMETAHGRNVLELMRQQLPTLVLLDLMLPEVSGLEICRAIKADPALRAAKVVVLTARADESARFEALQNGADDFLTKPFSTLELQARVGNLLRAAELERLQQEYLRNLNRQTVEGLSTGVLLVNASGKVLLSNSALQGLCGVARRPELLSDLRAELAAAIRASLELTRQGQMVQNQAQELPRVNGDSAPQHVLLSVRPVPGTAEQEALWVVMLHDITDYKRLEALTRQREGLVRVGEAASAINHELRNLVQPIRTQIEKLAAVSIDNAVYQHAMTVLPDRVAALNKLLDSLRDLGRPIELRMRKIDVMELADAICQELTVDGAPQAIRFEKRVEHSPAECFADGHWLRQALYNLMRNAVEATAGVSNPRVTLSIRAQNEHLVLDVADNGCGIAPELKPRLFEPFFSTKGERGTGLGLSIARKIVVLHGGSIDAESAVGGGTCFRVMLPAKVVVPH